MKGENNMKKARCLVLDVANNKVYEKECSQLQDYYDALGCDCFDIATRKVGNKYFDMFVDDIGLFRDSPIPSVLDANMQPMLVGNVVIANHDDEGNTTSLTDDDITLIKESIVEVCNVRSEPLKHWSVIMADY